MALLFQAVAQAEKKQAGWEVVKPIAQKQKGGDFFWDSFTRPLSSVDAKDMVLERKGGEWRLSTKDKKFSEIFRLPDGAKLTFYEKGEAGFLVLEKRYAEAVDISGELKLYMEGKGKKGFEKQVGKTVCGIYLLAPHIETEIGITPDGKGKNVKKEVGYSFEFNFSTTMRKKEEDYRAQFPELKAWKMQDIVDNLFP